MNKATRNVILVAVTLVVSFFSLPVLLQQTRTTTVQPAPARAVPPHASSFAAPSIQTPASPQTVQPPSAPPAYAPPQNSSGVIENAWENHASNLSVTEMGVVSRILPDDTKGSRHQRFILSLASGHTILIAHNIDIAPRVSGLREGDQVSFSGVFEWNDKGGVVHWTHHDPSGRHNGGYLQHNGRYYQ